jgi:hypothetical protein
MLLPARARSGISWSQALVIAVTLCWLTLSVGTRTRQTWQRQIAVSFYRAREPGHYQIVRWAQEGCRCSDKHNRKVSSP